MTDHNELAARIERAEGPDLRELECRVWALLDSSGISFEMMRAVVPDLNQWASPPVLRSIDAAMQLADEMTSAQIWDIWHRALRDCSRAGADLRTDLARFVSAAAIRARSAS